MAAQKSGNVNVCLYTELKAMNTIFSPSLYYAHLYLIYHISKYPLKVAKGLGILCK
jgi:hypothetical protein